LVSIFREIDMVNILRVTAIVWLCALLATGGCATSGALSTTTYAPPTGVNTTQNVLAEYVQKLPPGTDVRVGRVRGHSMRGTLMKATDQSIFLQPKTRVPEPMVEIPIGDVVEVTPEHRGNSVGRAIGAGAAAGAAATLAIFLIMFAVYGD
jgi:hypothetical protein